MDWQTFQTRCCSLDLETNENGDIFAIGAVFNDKTFLRKAPFNIQKVLAEFDAFAADATYLLGHNILEHDLPVCRAISPQLKFLQKPAVDTLLLSPLAFPENPYHRLVKDYKLVRDSPVGRNKPVRAAARTDVSGNSPNLPEKLPLLLTPLAYIHVGNATSRYALGWPIPAYKAG